MSKPIGEPARNVKPAKKLQIELNKNLAKTPKNASRPQNESTIHVQPSSTNVMSKNNCRTSILTLSLKVRLFFLHFLEMYQLMLSSERGPCVGIFCSRRGARASIRHFYERVEIHILLQAQKDVLIASAKPVPGCFGVIPLGFFKSLGRRSFAALWHSWYAGVV